MSKAKSWILIDENPPPLDKEVWLLWTDRLTYGRIEGGHRTIRKRTGKVVWRYAFCGSLKPTHWFPQIELPPLPEINSEGESNV